LVVQFFNMTPMNNPQSESSPDDVKCIVLWMVNRPVFPRPAVHMMMPVAKTTDSQHVWFATEFSHRLVFESFAQATEMKKRIVAQYGGDEVVAIVADDPRWEDPQLRDRHLPHWAWEAKYVSPT